MNWLRRFAKIYIIFGKKCIFDHVKDISFHATSLISRAGREGEINAKAQVAKLTWLRRLARSLATWLVGSWNQLWGVNKITNYYSIWPKFTGIRHSPLSFLLNLYRSVLIRRLQNPLALLLVSANGYKAYSNAIQIKAITFQYTQMRTNSIDKVINVILEHATRAKLPWTM